MVGCVEMFYNACLIVGRTWLFVHTFERKSAAEVYNFTFADGLGSCDLNLCEREECGDMSWVSLLSIILG